MCRDDHGRPASIDQFKQLHNLPCALRIKIARGFIGKEHHRSIDDRSRNAHTLLLTGRKAVRQLIILVIDRDGTQGLRDLATNVFLSCPLYDQRKRHIVEHGFFRQEPKVLKDRSDLPAKIGNLGRSDFGHILAVNKNLPLVRLLLPDQHAKQSRLPGSARAHE